MTAEDRAKLRLLLDSFDETGLIALASRGLVRRATKDLQSGGISFEETDDAVVVTGPGWTVIMPPDGPALATDDTKASGVTRQIVTATMFLRAEWRPDAPQAESVSAAETTGPDLKIAADSAAASEPSSADGKSTAARIPPEVSALEQRIAAIQDRSLEKWAGKGRLREAVLLADGDSRVEMELTAACVTLRFIEHELECRFFPPATGKVTENKLLDGALCTAPRSQRKLWVTAAVLAMQKLSGQKIRSPDSVAPPDAAGAPRNRGEVVAATRELLKGMVATGLAHPSSRMIERLLTLSVSATGVHLPKLARQLRGLADDIDLTLSRDAKSDTARVVERVATTHTLVSAIESSGEQPAIEFAGQHRTEYVPVGELLLTGVGAWPWRTGSGFVGLTVLFWETSAKRFLSWSTSRPEDGSPVFRPREVYDVESVWSGGGSPSTLSRHQFTLKSARVNPLGRLSGSRKSSVERASPTEFRSTDFGNRLFQSWRELAAFSLTTCPMGLRETSPLDQIVVLEPSRWGERAFDELQQRFLWPVIDTDGRSLSLSLPWASSTESSIEFLEAARPERDRLRAVVARVAAATGGLIVEPISLLSDGTRDGSFVLNPAFDFERITTRQSGLLARLRHKYGRSRIVATMMVDDDLDGYEIAEAGVLLPTGLERRLSELEGLILEVCESGTRRFSELHEQRFRDLAAGFLRLGLNELASVVVSVNEDPSGAILRASYLCRLHRQAAIRELVATAY